jgi:hypothetical protein
MNGVEFNPLGGARTEKRSAVLAVLKQDLGVSNSEVARRLGVSRALVARLRHNPVYVDRRWPPAPERPRQETVRTALAGHPRGDGEGKMRYCERIAEIAGVSSQYVHHTIEIIRCERLGEVLRAKEAEEATKLVPLSLNARAVPAVSDFKGWSDVFSRFKLLAEAYLNLALARGDKYAESFLKDLRDHSARAETRSWLDQSPQ